MKLFWNVVCEIYTALVLAGLKIPPSKIFFHQPKTINDYQLVEEIHADISFNKEERTYILEGAKIIEYFSNEQIKFDIVFDLDLEYQNDIQSQSTMLRVSKLAQIIIETDGYYHHDTLGLCQYNHNGTKTIYLVHERLNKPNTFRNTIAHELGHLIGLDHTNGRSIMHRHINNILYPTYGDAIEFAKKFNCTPEDLRYFKL